jgi:hypothetical protein
LVQQRLVDQILKTILDHQLILQIKIILDQQLLEEHHQINHLNKDTLQMLLLDSHLYALHLWSSPTDLAFFAFRVINHNKINLLRKIINMVNKEENQMFLNPITHTQQQCSTDLHHNQQNLILKRLKMVSSVECVV